MTPQITENSFSKIRGKSAETLTVVILTGYNGKNNNFVKCPCKGCNGLMVRGICVKCGFVVVCCRCNKLKLADGSTIELSHTNGLISHGLCRKCRDITIEENKLLVKKDLEKRSYQQSG